MKAVSPVLLRPAVELPEVRIAEHQEEYETLPAIYGNSEYGLVTSRVELTWRVRIQIHVAGIMCLRGMPGRDRLRRLTLFRRGGDLAEWLGTLAAQRVVWCRRRARPG